MPDYQVAGIATRRAFIKQNGDAVRGFIKAMIEATATFKNDPAAALKFTKERLKIDEPAVIRRDPEKLPALHAHGTVSEPRRHRRHQIIPE